VVVDPEQGPVIQTRRVRAFEEDIERDGVAASKIVQLGEGLYIGGMGISCDAAQLVFGVVDRATDESGVPVEYANIRAVNTGGGGISQLTTGRWMDIDPSFSVDGRYLYFASNRLRNRGLDLFRISSQTKGGGIAVIHRQSEGWSRTPSEGAGGIVSFTYRPRYHMRAGVDQVWTLGGRMQYPTQLREGSQPRMSPDGTRIAFIGPDNKLWLLGIESLAPVQLTTDPKTIESEPTWTPDGHHIVYVSNEGKDNTGQPNNDIWIMREDGTGRRQLTTNGSDDTTPVIDPQQGWVYFVSNRGYKTGVWRIRYPSDVSE
jgi:tricorn protease-like protein